MLNAGTPTEHLLLPAYTEQAIASGGSVVAASDLAERGVDAGWLGEHIGPASSEM